MDLETENRIAAILMKEAAELRRQAARDGIDAYLHPPNVRGRPNSRFLTATVLGVQQANRAVEVNEMWRARQKEKEMEDRVRKDEKRGRNNNGVHDSKKNYDDYERKHSSLCSSSKSPSEDGLKDKEIEEFLHSRAKRGRGAVGSRMDETGPYLPNSKEKDIVTSNDDKEWWDNRAVLGPEKPRDLRAKSSSDEEGYERREKRTKRDGSSSSSSKRRSKEKSKDKKKKKREREKKRSKHH